MPQQHSQLIIDNATAARREAALFVSLADAGAARIGEAFLDRTDHFAQPDPGVWFRRAVGVIPRYEQATRALQETIRAQEAALAQIERQLEAHRAQPTPLLGSHEAAEFSRRVRDMERQLTQVRGEVVDLRQNGGDPVDVEQIRRGVARVLTCALASFAHRVAADSAPLFRDAIPRLRQALSGCDEYAATVARAEAAAGQSLVVPQLVAPTTIQELLNAPSVRLVAPDTAKAA